MHEHRHWQAPIRPLATMSPVTSTPCRSLSLGMANAVQPSSSKMPVGSPTARPISSTEVVPLLVKIRGRNIGEMSDSARSTAIINSGAVRSATTYQRAPHAAR